MTSRLILPLLLAICAFVAGQATAPRLTAQSPVRPVPAPETRPYADGTVWVMEFARIRENGAETLLDRLTQDWRLTLDLARGEGLVVSYHVFHSTSATPRDWDLATMIEVRNMAALGVINARLGEVTGGSGSRFKAGLSDLREIVGTKIAREILFRPTR
jgi:hypothetical protein